MPEAGPNVYPYGLRPLRLYPIPTASGLSEQSAQSQATAPTRKADTRVGTSFANKGRLPLVVEKKIGGSHTLRDGASSSSEEWEAAEERQSVGTAWSSGLERRHGVDSSDVIILIRYA